MISSGICVFKPFSNEFFNELFLEFFEFSIVFFYRKFK